MFLIINYLRVLAFKIGISDDYLVTMSKYIELPIVLIINVILTMILTGVFYLYVLVWGYDLAWDIFLEALVYTIVPTVLIMMIANDILLDNIKKVIGTTVLGYVCVILVYCAPVFAFVSLFLNEPIPLWFNVTYPQKVIPMYTYSTVIYMLLALGVIPWIKGQALGYTAWKTGVYCDDFDDFISRRQKYRTSKVDLEVMRTNMDFFSSRVRNCIFAAMMTPFIVACFLPALAEDNRCRKPISKKKQEISTEQRPIHQESPTETYYSDLLAIDGARA